MNDLTDLTDVTLPRSDQLNADDLLTGPITVTIRDIQRTGSKEQPIALAIDGRQPYKPCLGMRRVLINAWGKNGLEWVGKSMTLFREPTVLWQGKEEGGIQVSHVSHIDGPKTIALTVRRGKRVKFVVQPLATPNTQPATNDPTRAAQCRKWLTAQGIAEQDAIDLIGKSLDEATENDFAKIGRMQA